jgi:CHAD domain-containing protein
VERLGPGASAGDGVRGAIAASVERLLRHDPGIRIGGDPEDVHQARVATRRLRSDLATFGPLLDPEWTGGLREELGWLGAELGLARDSEVQDERMRLRLEEVPPADRPAAARLVASLSHDAGEIRARLLESLRSERYLALLERLVEAAREPLLTEAAAEPAGQTLPGLARRPWKRLDREVRGLGAEPADERLHLVRIRAKRARYAAEAVAPVVGKPAIAFAAAAAKLQGVLGEHQDSVVAQERLRRAARGRQAFAAGLLLAAEHRAAEKARGEWRRAWRALRGRKLREWMLPHPA